MCQRSKGLRWTFGYWALAPEKSVQFIWILLSCGLARSQRVSLRIAASHCLRAFITISTPTSAATSINNRIPSTRAKKNWGNPGTKTKKNLGRRANGHHHRRPPDGSGEIHIRDSQHQPAEIKQ